MTVISSAYERARLRKAAEACKGSTVLDLGYAQYPNPYLEGFYRVGVDLNLPADGEQIYEEQIVGDATALSEVIGGRKFDSIILGEIIEHVKEPYALMSDLHQFLNDEGILIVTTPNPLGFPVVFLELLGIKSHFYTRDHVYYFLPRWMERIIDFSGYDLLDTRSVGLWLPFGRLPIWPKVLSYQLVYVCRSR